MSDPRRTVLLLVVTLTMLACACTGSALAAAAPAGKHRASRSVRVCWTSTRHGKRGRHCHRRSLPLHGTHRHAGARSPVKHVNLLKHINALKRAKAVKHTDALKHLATVKQAKVTVLSATPAPATSTPPLSGPANAEAASIASVLATPCQGADLAPEAGNLATIRSATFCLINQVRARQGEPPLAPDAELERAAQSHSDEMVSADYFDHVAPSGETPLDRLQAAGYIPGPPEGYVIGENIAWGTLSLATPNAIVAAWLASPEHLANILDARYRDSAIGVTAAAPAALADGQPGAVYTQEFGVILR